MHVFTAIDVLQPEHRVTAVRCIALAVDQHANGVISVEACHDFHGDIATVTMKSLLGLWLEDLDARPDRLRRRQPQGC